MWWEIPADAIPTPGGFMNAQAWLRLGRAWSSQSHCNEARASLAEGARRVGPRFLGRPLLASARRGNGSCRVFRGLGEGLVK